MSDDPRFDTLNELLPPDVKIFRVQPNDQVVMTNFGKDFTYEAASEVKRILEPIFGIPLTLIGPDVKFYVVRGDVIIDESNSDAD